LRHPLWRAGVALLACGVLAGCGGGATGPSAKAAAQNCAKGTAGAAGTIAVVQEADAGVGTIDGKCWASILPTPITNSVIGTAPAGVSAWTKVAWSAKNLYALVWVQEWPLPASGANLWNAQTVEFYVSGNNDKSGPYGPQDGQFGIMAGNTTLNKGTDNLPADPTPLSEVVQNKGYYAELVVPWSVLGVTAPAKGQTYKYDAAADFGDASGKQIAQTMWVGTQNNYQVTTDWGSIALG